ncbi:MAG: hypothetical protein BGP04_07225 [Rhizobiales bacterium 62-17]|nr:MAG: hypothetical protein BGP04_07225 [Rhizobiales bacterium 62-17]
MGRASQNEGGAARKHDHAHNVSFRRSVSARAIRQAEWVQMLSVIGSFHGHMATRMRPMELYAAVRR